MRYILSEHKYISTATRQLKTLDPRIILSSTNEDETQTLLLSTAHPVIFDYLWSTFPSLFAFDSHLVPLLSHLASLRNFDLIRKIYGHPTT